jgi:hypothetical protein
VDFTRVKSIEKTTAVEPSQILAASGDFRHAVDTNLGTIETIQGFFQTETGERNLDYALKLFTASASPFEPFLKVVGLGVKDLNFDITQPIDSRGVSQIGDPRYTEVSPNPDQNFDMAYLKGKMQNRSFSGCDIVPTVTLPGQSPRKIGDISTISISTHRESFPVRMCGRANPIGFTRGPRTIAGTLIFSLIDMYPWYKLIANAERPVWQHAATYPLADSLPPFDITVTFHNEYEETGAVMRLFGVVIVDDGMTLSIDDLVTENTYSYIAAGIAPVHQLTSWGIERGLENIEYAVGDEAGKMGFDFQNGIIGNAGAVLNATRAAIEDNIPAWMKPSSRPSAPELLR